MSVVSFAQFIVQQHHHEHLEVVRFKLAHAFFLSLLGQVLGDGLHVDVNIAVFVRLSVENVALGQVFHRKVKEVIEQIVVEAFLQLLRQVLADIVHGLSIVLCVFQKFIVD